MQDFDVEYIKNQFCKFKCKNKKPVTNDDNKCKSCDIIDICDKLEIGCSNLIDSELCDVCQIDNFIKELRDFCIIN